MRGAALLSGLEDCAVVDIGGTTSDVGILQHGYPREASTAIEIGGVRTNFRMPDVLSLGIGGGSIVREDGVGPDSVGYELDPRALVFGGDTLTASDVAIAAGRAEFGDPERVRALDPGLVRDSLASIERRIADAVDSMKTVAGDIAVVLVGGGSILLGDRLDGASRVVRPEHFGVANAIGAAIGQIGGEVERVFALDRVGRDAAVAEAREEAVEKAVAAGAAPDSVRIVDIEEVALAYVPGNATRIKVKAVGDLQLGRERRAAAR
jgi:N-methylhydantoinase A/oxoprolinase/acetone carboxylase beta subunit